MNQHSLSRGRWLIIIVLGVFLSGCATYVIRGAKSQSLKPGATIGIMLEGPGDQSQFSAFMAASLINRGYKVVHVHCKGNQSLNL